MTKTCKALLIGLCAQAVFSTSARAAGISVEPSYVRVTNLEVKGTTRVQKESGYLLKINNKEAVPVVYTVSVLACKEMNIKPNGGYENFPDMKWFVFKSTEVTIPAGGTGYLPFLELKAPRGGKYLNKKWQAILKVAKKNTETINMEALIPLWLETKLEVKAVKKPGDKK